MARLNWTDQSIQDMVNIADFIAKDSVRYAKITIDRIRSASQQLKVYPASGRKVPETDNDAIRELILGNYRIIYSIVSKDEVMDIFQDKFSTIVSNGHFSGCLFQHFL